MSRKNSAWKRTARTQKQQHFSSAVHADIRRSTFNRNSSLKTTFNASYIVPIYVDEILPGDTMEMTLAHVTRLATPVFPTMDDIRIEFHAWFVPNRIVWDGWEELNGENKTSAWAPTEPPALVPTAVMNSNGPANIMQGSIGDYYGIPRGMSLSNTEISVLPFRGYGLIDREWYRDQNHQAPRVIETGDVEPTTSEYLPNMPLFRACKPRDYFTTALPSTQKGDAQGLSLGQIQLPVGWLPVADRHTGPTYSPLRTPAGIHGESNINQGINMATSTTGANAVWINQTGTQNVTGSNSQQGRGDLFAGVGNSNTGPAGTTPLSASNLWTMAGGSGDGFTSIGSALVSDLRLAFQLQRLLERDARGGTRYVEMLKAHFGVEAEDYRLQRPEFLGSHTCILGMNQVPQTSSTDATSPQANLSAYGMEVEHVPHLFRKTFVEHGYIHIFAIARQVKTYQQGIERFWFRRERFDFYYPALAHISEQPIYNREIYANDSGANGQDGEVFGYQEAWADYRYKPNRTSAGFRSMVGVVDLDRWHYGDVYDGLPILGNDWIIDNSYENIARTLAVTSDIQDQFLADIAFGCRSTRAMPVHSVPGMVDHF